VYCTNLTTSGSSNVLQLAAVTGLVSDPQTIKLIAYDSAAPNFSLQLPSGLYGYLENDTVNKTINAVVTTSPPKNVVWNGNLSGNWNNSTANWQGGQLFFPGDSARFDDSASGTRSVSVVGTQPVGSGGVTISNAGPAYSFSGGTIAGTSIMTKQGTGGLTLGNASQLPLTIQGGDVVVTASGASGLATVSSGASITSAGSVNGFTSSGTAVNTGIITANGANINGGTFLNSGTVTGAVNVASSASATNSVSGTIYTVGTSTIATNAVLVNNGVIINTTARLTVDGTLTGTGRITDADFFNPANPTAGVDGRVAVSGTISPGNSIGTMTIEGRFDLNQNANLVIECSISGSVTNYDVVACDYWGAIRGNIVMTNIGPNPFAVGQSFLIVSNNLGQLNDKNVNPNADFKFVPPSPGLGMLWDRTDVFTNGIARIKAIPTTPTTLSMTVTTNVMTLSWPESYIGWELQQQLRALTNGISTFATNWTLIANSTTTNQVFINVTTNNEAAFYRLAHPAYQ
jgi:hypothetical protein